MRYYKMAPPVQCSDDDQCLQPGEYCVNQLCQLPPWGYIDPNASCEDAKKLLNQKGYEICLNYEHFGCYMIDPGSQWDWCKNPNAQKGWDSKDYEWSSKVILHHCGNKNGVTPCACSCAEGT